MIIHDIEWPIRGLEIAWMDNTVSMITEYITDIPYPVKGGRKLALQEAETVCCVFKQHVVGDYQYGFRSAKAWKRLNGVEGKPAAALREGLLAGGIWTPEDLDGVGRHL